MKAGVGVLAPDPDVGFWLSYAERFDMKAGLVFEDRLVSFAKQLESFLEEANPTHAFIEDVWFNPGVPNLRSMTQVAKVVGVASAITRRRDIPVVLLNVKSVRHILGVKANRGDVAKKIVRKQINRRFEEDLALLGYPKGLLTAHQDVADAIAVAWAGTKWKSTEQ